MGGSEEMNTVSSAWVRWPGQKGAITCRNPTSRRIHRHPSNLIECIACPSLCDNGHVLHQSWCEPDLEAPEIRPSRRPSQCNMPTPVSVYRMASKSEKQWTSRRLVFLAFDDSEFVDSPMTMIIQILTWQVGNPRYLAHLFKPLSGQGRISPLLRYYLRPFFVQHQSTQGHLSYVTMPDVSRSRLLFIAQKPPAKKAQLDQSR